MNRTTTVELPPRYKLLLAEFEVWIDRNPQATTHDLPDHMLAQLDTRLGQDVLLGTTDERMEFAMAAFERNCDLPSGFPHPSRFEMVSEYEYGFEFLYLFERWQLSLSAVSLHRRSAQKSQPVPLLQFSSPEQLIFFTENTSPRQ